MKVITKIAKPMVDLTTKGSILRSMSEEVMKSDPQTPADEMNPPITALIPILNIMEDV